MTKKIDDGIANKINSRYYRILYIEYTEYTTGGEVCEGDEDSDWPNYDPKYTDFDISCVRLKKDSWFHEKVETDFDRNIGDKVYILVGRYTTGCTFGSSHGCFSFEGVYKTLEDLERKKKELNKQYQQYLAKSLEYEDYKPWMGHFESLEEFQTFVKEII